MNTRCVAENWGNDLLARASDRDPSRALRWPGRRRATTTLASIYNVNQLRGRSVARLGRHHAWTRPFPHGRRGTSQRSISDRRVHSPRCLRHQVARERTRGLDAASRRDKAGRGPYYAVSFRVLQPVQTRRPPRVSMCDFADSTSPTHALVIGLDRADRLGVPPTASGWLKQARRRNLKWDGSSATTASARRLRDLPRWSAQSGDEKIFAGRIRAPTNGLRAVAALPRIRATPTRRASGPRHDRGSAGGCLSTPVRAVVDRATNRPLSEPAKILIDYDMPACDLRDQPRIWCRHRC